MVQPTETVARQVEPKRDLKPGTPEGDKPIRVRVMRPCTYGQSAAFERRYEVGEELVIPAWRYTSWHEKYDIKDKEGRVIFSQRGSFELADRPRAADDNVGKPSLDTQSLLDENERLRQRLAILESAHQPGLPNQGAKAKRQEI